MRERRPLPRPDLKSPLSPEQPTEPSENLAQETPEGPGILQEIRNHPLAAPTALAMMLAGQLSLYVPRGFERENGVDEAVAAHRLSVGEVRDLVKSGNMADYIIAAHPGQVRVVVKPEAVGIRGGDVEFEEIMVPGLVTKDRLEVPMEWIGRYYQENPTAVGGSTPTETAIQAGVDLTLKDFTALGLSPNDLIVSMSVEVEGYASPEGDSKNNLTASEKRADHTGEVTLTTLTGAGIDAGKISLHTEGLGEEGSLFDFLDALDAIGISFPGRTLNDKIAKMLPVIRACNNGTETRPDVLKAFHETITSHRRASITITTQRADVLYKVPKGGQEIIHALEHYAPLNDPAKEPVDPPQITDLPPDDTDPPPPPPPYTYPKPSVRAPKNIMPQVTRDIFPSMPIRTTGTSTGHSIPRAHHTSGGYQHSTGRNIQNPKRSGGQSKGRRNGSR
ncbi:MAG: hypothetical protein COW24_04255 [Candidatus Kerfeldbacteria bacterium CG15_BIG_FIL_POST_REV_8_21_14_020_45_12]|uniref:Uncharacterized protein n=1 Tax=Candidatus Kerfeldbacteria bacterium CG15_BIG_FIL_POST_REV_8_21_14_020_45_12 TaxID=2014247 RepID=A0A2M7H370_9BACT|nr:MAG: hypothetical protein COW24_04255 [Candidatus Kerfeldbacteria bacterium CG15_BIG_FIL_POST_REV_8_21_14_020_45_12]PJA93312.1 MAG: hypothetical protein CO132_03730 [Candidatus Kerfeldbacteria bacterium CG_4_9_14_3_um_filter_45_8]